MNQTVIVLPIILLDVSKHNIKINLPKHRLAAEHEIGIPAMFHQQAHCVR